MLKKNKQLKKQNKAVKDSKKTKHSEQGRLVQVTFTLDKDGTVSVSSSVPNLALVRGMTEEGLDILKGADVRQFNYKQVARAKAVKADRAKKQREDAKKWNQNEKAKLNKNVDKKNDK